MVTCFCINDWQKYVCAYNSKTDLSDHPFIKNDIFEGKVNFTPQDNPIGMIILYCEHHNMSYVS